ncbi:MAG: hypothetical protein K0R51_40 [Cytophagaceae bacterium]|jgi:hypothetical protein|nr:hypothetical protein [Cytophagaceae bacterium]
MLHFSGDKSNNALKLTKSICCGNANSLKVRLELIHNGHHVAWFSVYREVNQTFKQGGYYGNEDSYLAVAIP